MMWKARLLVFLLGLLATSIVGAEDKIAVVNEGGIGSAWMLAPGTTLPVPAYPTIYEDSHEEVCVAIGYLINPDGTTSDFSLLKFWAEKEPNGDADSYRAVFAQDASNALARWRFAPRPEVSSPKPVYTVATFLFAAKSAELRTRCAIPSLMAHILEMRYDRRSHARMSRLEIFSRLALDPAMESRYQQMLDAPARHQQEQRERDAIRNRSQSSSR